MKGLKLLISVVLLCALLAHSAEQPNADLSITATRTIDITSQIVKATTEYEIKNNGKTAANSFLHGISANDEENLAWILANVEKRDGKKLKTAKVEVQSAPKGQVFYRIELANSLDAGATVKVLVRTEVTQVLKAHPATITQSENQ